MKINKYLPTILIILIILIGAFFRLYRIREYMIFLGDEGRDVLVVKRMLIDHKFTLLGPITSVGSMYIGPIYYYFMAPFLFLFRFDPVGPAVMVALFSIATIWLIYYLTRQYLSTRSALISSFLYAISPLTIIQGRSSWNPNIVPFFSLLIIYGLLKTVVDKKYGYLLLVGLAFGICVQLHYISLMFIPIIICSLLLLKFKLPLKYYFYLCGGFLLTWSPFLAFEIRHEFTNIRAVINFLSFGGKSSVLGLSAIFSTMSDILIRLFWRLVVIESAEMTKLLLVFLSLGLGLYYYRSKNKPPALAILFIWFFIGLLSFGLYKGIIYDYYMVPLFALPFILTGIFLDNIWKMKNKGMIISILVLLILTYFNLKKNPLLSEPNNLLQNSQDISRFVFTKIDHQPYNFALLAGRNSDHAYRYFLELWGNPPVPIENPTIDPERKTVQSLLYIVCEEKECHPLGHPLWEIAGFGRAEIQGDWKVSTARVFKLVHFKSK